jgi:hypothetical protein
VIVGSLLLILVAVGLLVAGVLGGSNALIVCSIVVVILAAIVLVIGVRQSAATAGTLEDVDDEEPDERDRTSEYAVSDSGFRMRQSERRTRAASRSDAYRDSETETFAGGDYGTPTEYGSSSEYASSDYNSNGHGSTGYGSNEYGSGEHNSAAATTADHGPLAIDAPSRGIPSQAYGAATETYQQAGAYETQLIDAVGDDFDDEDPPDEPSAQIVTPASAARVAMLSTDVLVVDGRPRYHVPGCVHLLSRETEPLPVGEAVELGFTPCGLCEPDSALLADARRV